MEKDLLKWLQSWYAGRCDGEWEKFHGVEIGSLDRGGWRLEVDLAGTGLEGRSFSPVRRRRSDADWIECRIQGGRFEGRGGPGNLGDLLEAFRGWAGGA